VFPQFWPQVYIHNQNAIIKFLLSSKLAVINIDWNNKECGHFSWWNYEWWQYWVYQWCPEL